MEATDTPVEIRTMILEQVVHSVESRLVNLGRRLLADTQAAVEEQGERIRAELKQQRLALERQRMELATVQERLRDNENAVGNLPYRIARCMHNGQSSDAYQLALRLDEARQQLPRDQATLPRLEQVCWSLQFRIRQLERRLAILGRQR